MKKTASIFLNIAMTFAVTSAASSNAFANSSCEGTKWAEVSAKVERYKLHTTLNEKFSMESLANSKALSDSADRTRKISTALFHTSMGVLISAGALAIFFPGGAGYATVGEAATFLAAPGAVPEGWALLGLNAIGIPFYFVAPSALVEMALVGWIPYAGGPLRSGAYEADSSSTPSYLPDIFNTKMKRGTVVEEAQYQQRAKLLRENPEVFATAVENGRRSFVAGQKKIEAKSETMQSEVEESLNFAFGLSPYKAFGRGYADLTKVIYDKYNLKHTLFVAEKNYAQSLDLLLAEICRN